MVFLIGGIWENEDYFLKSLADRLRTMMQDFIR